MSAIVAVAGLKGRSAVEPAAIISSVIFFYAFSVRNVRSM